MGSVQPEEEPRADSKRSWVTSRTHGSGGFLFEACVTAAAWLSPAGVARQLWPEEDEDEVCAHIACELTVKCASRYGPAPAALHALGQCPWQLQRPDQGMANAAGTRKLAEATLRQH